MRIALAAVWLMLWPAMLAAQTAISDTLYDPSGDTVNGRVEIVPTAAFVTSGGAAVSRQKFVYTITNGVLSFNLQPTVSATPSGVSYTATFYLENRSSHSETWVVPISGPVTLADIRTDVAPTPSAYINLSLLSVSGVSVGDILTAQSGPTWARLAAGSEGQVLKISSGVPAWGTDLGGGGAPTDAQYWVSAANGTLSAEVVVNSEATLESALGGINLAKVGDNVATATALAANGDNCPAGSVAGGVDASGAAESCIDPLTAAEQNAGTDVTADLEEETHASEHAENGADELLGESLGTACSENQILKANASGGLDCATDETGGGSPGGASGQIQYNNSSSFGGIAGSSWSGSVLTQPSTTIDGDTSTTLQLQGGSAQGTDPILKVVNDAGTTIYAEFGAFTSPSAFTYAKIGDLAFGQGGSQIELGTLGQTLTIRTKRDAIGGNGQGSGINLGGSQGRPPSSGSAVGVEVSEDFDPASGTATYAGLSVTSEINQTGGANGVTRGIYVDPTLTAAADFRAIEALGGPIVAPVAEGFCWGGSTVCMYGPSSSEPVSCSAAIRGSTYYDTDDDKLCVCANDGTDDEWMQSDDYGHATGHCSL